MYAMNKALCTDINPIGLCVIQNVKILLKCAKKQPLVSLSDSNTPSSKTRFNAYHRLLLSNRKIYKII